MAIENDGSKTAYEMAIASADIDSGCNACVQSPFRSEPCANSSRAHHHLSLEEIAMNERLLFGFISIFSLVSGDVLCGAESKLVHQAPSGQLHYASWNDKGDTLPDFSYCGYREGGASVPRTENVLVLEPSGAENELSRIQDALDKLGAMPIGENGMRGALLLKKGLWKVGGSIFMRHDGIVLRGEGQGEDGTVIMATLRKPHDVLVIGRSASGQLNDEPLKHESPEIAGGLGEGKRSYPVKNHVPVGSRVLTVPDAHFKAGEEVLITRPGTKEWIDAIGMGKIPERPGVVQWSPSAYSFGFFRKIRSVDGDCITLEIPLVQSIDENYGGGRVASAALPSYVKECGIENIRLESEFDGTVKTKMDGVIPEHFSDENHACFGVVFLEAENCWMRNSTGAHFLNGLTKFDRKARRISVIDCSSLDPVSKIEGGRRSAFLMAGCQQVLVLRCFGRNNRHDFVTGSQVCGPNAFVDCRAESAWAGSENHQRWAMGTLWDNVRVEGKKTGLYALNRGNLGTGHGWTGNSSVFWNCAAPSILVDKPPLGQNFAIGCSDPGLYDQGQADLSRALYNKSSGMNEVSSAPLSGTGYIESPLNTVEPQSLYYAQLSARLGADAVLAIKKPE